MARAAWATSLRRALGSFPATIPAALGAAGTVLTLALGLTHCGQTPQEQPIRTFERAQRMDVLCLKLNGNALAEGLPESACSTVGEVTGSTEERHLIALVTQSARGELAVVDLTANTVVDTDIATPGRTFLPVGAQPVDVASAPNGSMAFVATAEPNRPALYAIAANQILGDRPGGSGVVSLDRLKVCTLPERPVAVFAAPRAVASSNTPADPRGPFDVVVVLGGSRLSAGRVLMLDGDRFFDQTYTPGAPSACVIKASLGLRGDYAATVVAGPAWGTGLPYAPTPQAGLPLPVGNATCNAVVDGGGEGGAPGDDGGAPDADAGGAIDAALGDAVAPIGDAGDGGTTGDRETDEPRPGAATRDGEWLYVADNNLPIIHVVRLGDTLTELPPLEMTSVLDVTRKPTASALAVSPPTRDFKKFLYAVERQGNALAVFDVTTPGAGSVFPLTRPYAALNPFQPPDRVAFGAPVVSVTFARNELSLRTTAGAAGESGLLCNPNPATTGGAYGPAGTAALPLGPTRLRGIFAFITLASGQVLTLDVDDWDSACRRPQNVDAVRPSDISFPQPAVDQDPYGVPQAAAGAVSGEGFFPVSAPHRVRSRFFLRDDSSSGNRLPHITGVASLVQGNTPLATTGNEGLANVSLLPPKSTLQDPVSPTAAVLPSSAALPGVRFALETPDVHVDQDWFVVYEGELQGFNGLPGVLRSSDNYQTLTLEGRETFFCRKGVEDRDVGTGRATQIRQNYPAALPAADFTGLLGDYVQIADDLLPESDPYWGLPNACWTGIEDTKGADLATSAGRAQYCSATFGTKDAPALSRDLPVLEAYEDRLVLGTYDGGRRIQGASPRNASALRAAQCCFHNQVRYRVRAGGEWVTTGSAYGLLHHVTSDTTGRCIASCDPREALLNARTVTVPRPTSGDPNIDRNSPLAMRNPLFSFVLWAGASGGTPSRDLTWRFTTQGGLAGLAIALGTNDTRQVAPQSMRALPSLGQVAVVDGALQGLLLIDLRNVQVVRSYF
jgi:hypothetical protein